MTTGITLIRNGESLNYPYIQCINQMFSICDRVIVNIGLSDDDTIEQLIDFKYQLPKEYDLELHITEWNMSNTGDGSELAKQANYCLKEIPDNEWVVYCQADEIIHEKDSIYLKNLMNNLSPEYSQIELYRTYFWKDMFHRNTEDEIWLGRIFRAGTNIVGGDGMHLVRESGNVYRSNSYLYHYSRMGTEKQVTKRIRELDLLFHDKKDVEKFEDFKYNKQINIVKHEGSHPHSMIGYYE